MPYVRTGQDRRGRWISRDQADALAAIQELESQRRRIGDRQHAVVQQARALGLSWALVGEALGISKQAAQKRYDRRLPLE